MTLSCDDMAPAATGRPDRKPTNRRTSSTECSADMKSLRGLGDSYPEARTSRKVRRSSALRASRTSTSALLPARTTSGASWRSRTANGRRPAGTKPNSRRCSSTAASECLVVSDGSGAFDSSQVSKICASQPLDRCRSHPAYTVEESQAGPAGQSRQQARALESLECPRKARVPRRPERQCCSLMQATLDHFSLHTPSIPQLSPPIPQRAGGRCADSEIGRHDEFIGGLTLAP